MNDTFKALLATVVLLAAVGVGAYIGLQVKPAPQPVGAVAGPDIYSPYLQWGGVRTWQAGSDTFVSGSYVFCSIQTPVSTSTISFAGARVDLATTSASKIWVALAATASASTTVLDAEVLAASAQGTLLASTTNASLATAATLIVAPSTYVNFGVTPTAGGGAATGQAPTGHCGVSFKEL
jgi:hypothetical protein